MEVEYHGTVNVGTEVIWIWKILGKFGFPIATLIVIYYDNHSAIQVAYNPVAHNKMKHFELHVHYVRHLVHEKVVSLLYYKTDDQVVDIFMKSLSEAKFVKFYDLIGLQETTIMGGCPTVILSFESPKCCVDGWGEGGVVGT